MPAKFPDQVAQAMLDDFKKSGSLTALSKAYGRSVPGIRNTLERLEPGIMRRTRREKDEAILAEFLATGRAADTARKFGITREAVRLRVNLLRPGLIAEHKALNKDKTAYTQKKRAVAQRKAVRQDLFGRIVEAYRQDPCPRRVAKKLGVAAATVRSMLQTSAPELLLSREDRLRAREELLAKAVEAYKKDPSTVRVAAKLGVSSGKVWNLLREGAPGTLKKRGEVLADYRRKRS